ncbi:MAG: histidinol-phosphate transaminase [Clostridia bacterium]|nr:histidinol-phosphate transaminase [Clostridia bacterium]
MSRFIVDKYKNMEAYVPGEQPQDMEYIKLNTNESPYPPSQEVIDAISESEVEKLRLYSDPECKILRNALAKRYNTTFENVFVSNGSDDILNFAFMAFSGDGVVFPEISYGFYSVFAELHGANFESPALNDDFTINPDDYMSKNKMIVIANPNAPTGISLSLNVIEDIIKSNPDNVVLIDEAYVDFGGESAIGLTEKYSNLLVVQTFSKSRSLAGARLGFAIANKEIIKDLEKIKYSTNPYSINRLSLIAGTAAVESDSYYMDNCKKIIKTREYTITELTKLGFKVLPSSANFIFAKIDGISGEEIYKNLRKNGILVRHFTKEKIKDYNRITIGTQKEMEKFISVISSII